MSIASTDNASDGFFVITLCVANAPIPLRVPFVHELVCFSVFRSRTIQDGNEIFHLHVGYFDSDAGAREALKVVQPYFPEATVSPAPNSALSSLDDTLNTSFQIINSARARVVSAEERRLVASPLSPTVEVQQRYVVQLSDSATPISSGSIRRLALFRPYMLYTVHLIREASQQHGLRLGFFGNLVAAQRLAELVRREYPQAIALPISQREYTRADQMMRQRALKTLATIDSLAASTPLANNEPIMPLSFPFDEIHRQL